MTHAEPEAESKGERGGTEPTMRMVSSVEAEHGCCVVMLMMDRGCDWEVQHARVIVRIFHTPVEGICHRDSWMA